MKKLSTFNLSKLDHGSDVYASAHKSYFKILYPIENQASSVNLLYLTN